MEEEWKVWSKHVLHELQRLNLEQKDMNRKLTNLLVFRTQMQTSVKVTTVVISAAFGLISLAITLISLAVAK